MFGAFAFGASYFGQGPDLTPSIPTFEADLVTVDVTFRRLTVLDATFRTGVTVDTER